MVSRKSLFFQNSKGLFTPQVFQKLKLNNQNMDYILWSIIVISCFLNEKRKKGIKYAENNNVKNISISLSIL